jgi:hypothetical protein
MAITVVNETNAEGLEFWISGMTNGSATPMWSGSLNPSGQPTATLVMEVSGYELYQVVFFPVGWNGGNQVATASTPEITDNVLVAFNIDVQPN